MAVSNHRISTSAMHSTFMMLSDNCDSILGVLSERQPSAPPPPTTTGLRYLGSTVSPVADVAVYKVLTRVNINTLPDGWHGSVNFL